MRCSMCGHGKPDKDFTKPNGGFYKTCRDCRDRGREYSRRYSATHPERRAASRKRFKASPKGKAAEKRYRQGERGRVTIKHAKAKYYATEKGQAVARTWLRSEKGQASKKRAKAKYRNSEKGKATEREYAKRHGKIYKQKNAQRIRARYATNNALRDGRLTKPLRCEICNQVAELRAHHYAGWDEQHHLNVWWLCKKCDPSFDSPLPHDGSMTLEQARELVIPIPAG